MVTITREQLRTMHSQGRIKGGLYTAPIKTYYVMTAVGYYGHEPEWFTISRIYGSAQAAHDFCDSCNRENLRRAKRGYSRGVAQSFVWRVI